VVETAFGLCLLLLAAAAFAGLYLPAREKRDRMATEVRTAEARLTRLGERIERLRLERDALRAGDPLTVDEAIRDVLRKGPHGDYLLRQELTDPDA
jgi:outer membrane murein-binding lipoprotein Lpp